MKRVIILSLFFYINLCNGQVQMNFPSLYLNQFPKLIKTQGSNQYQNIMCGMEDSKGNLWFGASEEGLYKYDGKLFTQFTMINGLTSNSVFSIMEDNEGIIWIGTSDGICIFDGIKIKSIEIPKEIRAPQISKGYYSNWSTPQTVWSIMQDKSGVIWLGLGDGVYKYKENKFTRFLADNSIQNKDSLKLKLVSDIVEDKNGIIWFASGMPPGYEGLCRFDGMKIESLKPKNEGWFHNIIQSKNGYLLLATRHYGVWSYDGKSFEDYGQPKEYIKSSLNRIIEDKIGRLWVASDYGKNLGDTLGGLWYSNIQKDTSLKRTFTKITNKDVYFMLEDKNSNIWFGTRGLGLFRFDGKKIDQYSK